MPESSYSKGLPKNRTPKSARIRQTSLGLDSRSFYSTPKKVARHQLRSNVAQRRLFNNQSQIDDVKCNSGETDTRHQIFVLHHLDALDNHNSPSEAPEADTPFREELLQHGLRKTCPATLLGKGSFGSVILAAVRGRKVAIKVMRCNGERKESNAMKLEHPNIARVIQILESPSNTLVYMEYAGSRNLQTILDGPLHVPTNFKQKCLIEVASAMSYCHSLNVLHLDLKPANVIVSNKGHCKLSDFGCSAKRDSEPIRSTCFLAGTVAYLGPEILKGAVASAKSDVYAFGIFLYQVWTRSQPFAFSNPHVLIYQVVSKGARPQFPVNSDLRTAAVFNMAARCWVSSPEDRPTAATVLQGLKRLWL